MTFDAAAFRAEIAAVADDGDFSGAVVVHRGGEAIVDLARGMADRVARREVTSATAFGLASITKGFTAVGVATMVEDGSLSWDTTVDELSDLFPMIDRGVTVEQLLSHTSGIGDYLDEELLGDIDDEVMTAPVRELVDPEAYLPMLLGHPQRETPGTVFRYNNSGFVVLSILMGAAGPGFRNIVESRILEPTMMTSSGFFDVAALPEHAAVGYLTDGRTNVTHLPARGAGDGGMYTTASDLLLFWAALERGAVLPAATVGRLTGATGNTIDAARNRQGLRYGLGFWRDEPLDLVFLVGMDAGVSACTGVHRSTDTVYAVLSNTSSGAWPVTKAIERHFAEDS